MDKGIILLFLGLISIVSCEKEVIDADAIVNKSIEVSGGDLIENSHITFDFRDKHYFAKRNNGVFSLARVFVENSDSIVDLLTNRGFERLVNNDIVQVVDTLKSRYSAAVNSVHYFSVLPYGLDAKAVNKTYLGVIKLEGKDYHKIEVTFNEKGGGEDFEDVFIYWIDTETFKVIYVAYSFHEQDGGLGFRFRKAYNERYIDGIRFVDYNNYKPTNENASLENIDNLFEAEGLTLLSKIELKNISVTR